MLIEKIQGNTYYLPGMVNNGIILGEDHKAIIIDTGLDDSAPRAIIRELKALGYTPGAIINTHFHADHVGGNQFIQKRFTVKTYAPPIDIAFIENTVLEPFYLFSAYPPKELRNKFLMAEPSLVENVLEDGEINILGRNLTIIDLKGHSPSQKGVITEDGVLFAADGYFAADIVEKHKIPYLSNLDDTKETLNVLKAINSKYILPSHGKIMTEDRQDIDFHLNRLEEIEQHMLSILKEPHSREEILAALNKTYDLNLNPGLYYLLISTISAFLSSLMDRGLVTYNINEGNMRFLK